MDKFKQAISEAFNKFLEDFEAYITQDDELKGEAFDATWMDGAKYGH